MKRNIILVVCLLIAIGGVIGWRMWNKPHEKVEDQQAIKMTASELCNEYSKNEAAANRAYLNKVLEISGNVAAIQKNQDNEVVVTLMGESDALSVQCTMRDNAKLPDSGQAAVISGFCSGNTMFDVLLTDCITK